MDHVEAAIVNMVRKTAETQLQTAEESVPEMVHQEVLAMAAIAKLSVLSLGSEEFSADMLGTAGSGLSRPSTADTGTLLPGLEGQKTIWEAVIAVGLPEVGILDTFMLFLGFVSTVSIQAFVCQTVGSGGRDIAQTISLFLGLLWRSIGMQGQRIWGDDSITNPLVSSSGGGEVVCTPGSDVTRCTEQMPGSVAPQVGSVGQSPPLVLVDTATVEDPHRLAMVFCVFASLCWVLLVGREMEQTLKWVRSVWALPRRSTRILWLGNQFVFISMSHIRVFFVLLMSLFRVDVAVSLLAVGLKKLSLVRSLSVLLILIAVLSFALDVPRRAAQHFFGLRSLGRKRLRQC